MTNAPSHFDDQGARLATITKTVLRIAALFVLVGALAKLFWGSPMDLPEQVLGVFPEHPLELFVAAIAIEVFIAVLALCSPRLGWIPLAALLAVFCVVSSGQVLSDEADCGCFGSLVTMPPWLMALIDCALLSAILLLMPWKRLRESSWRYWSMPVALVAAVAAAVFVIPMATSSDIEPQSNTNPTVAENDESLEPLINQSESSDGSDSGEERVELRQETPKAWSPPTSFPRFVVLKPNEWRNNSIDDSPLAKWIDTSKIPNHAKIIFYMKTCGHCADHIEELAASVQMVPLAFVEVPNVNSGYPIRVGELPDGTQLSLPDETQWVIKVPWDLQLRGRKVIKTTYLGE